MLLKLQAYSLGHQLSLMQCEHAFNGICSSHCKQYKLSISSLSSICNCSFLTGVGHDCCLYCLLITLLHTPHIPRAVPPLYRGVAGSCPGPLFPFPSPPRTPKPFFLDFILPNTDFSKITNDSRRWWHTP